MPVGIEVANDAIGYSINSKRILLALGIGDFG
jgi:hypothetical protein